jgi:site-specific DNA-methyltransferase (adenine-specific)
MWHQKNIKGQIMSLPSASILANFEQAECIGDCILLRGDCIEILPSIPDASIETTITDPPYEAQAHTKARRQLGKNAINGGKKITELPIDFNCMDTLTRNAAAHHIGRTTTGWSVVFCQVEGVHLWMAAFEVSPFISAYKRTSIWIKPDAAPQFTGDRPGMGYESLVMHWHSQGRSKWNGGGKHGIYRHGKSDPGYGHGAVKNEHPTKKPQSLMMELVTLYANAGDVVGDWFMGSGSTGVACVASGRKFIGIERDQKYFDIACERIAYAQRQQRMFL